MWRIGSVYAWSKTLSQQGRWRREMYWSNQLPETRVIFNFHSFWFYFIHSFISTILFIIHHSSTLIRRNFIMILAEFLISACLTACSHNLSDFLFPIPIFFQSLSYAHIDILLRCLFQSQFSFQSHWVLNPFLSDIGKKIGIGKKNRTGSVNRP